MKRKSRADRNPRSSSVMVISGLFIAVAVLLGALVADSINDITSSADAIDDRRAVNAAESAVNAMRKQLEGTIRDNAFWDDAFQQVGSEKRDEWIAKNWGATTQDYPLYDTAIVVDAAGNTVMAYENGEPIAVTTTVHFDGGVEALVAAARQENDVPVHFIRNTEGIVLMGAAAIRPSSPDVNFDRNQLHVLLFGRHLTANVVSEMSRDFSLPGLVLDRVPDSSKLTFPLEDVGNRTAGYFVLPRQRPGLKSLMTAKDDLEAAAMVLVMFLGGLGYSGFVTIRRLKAGEARARYKATHDALSGLLNRSGLLESLELEAEFDGDPYSFVQLNLIDLDGFKAVNDAWGHAVGDSLIVAVAKRLTNAMPKDAVLARLGGDEFAVVLSGTTSSIEAAKVASVIQSSLGGVFEIDGRAVEIGGSVGIVTSKKGELTASEMLRQADIALYHAKDSGRGVSISFEPYFDEETRRVAELEAKLRQTLTDGQIGVVFQPLVRSNGDGICGVEALARWQPADGPAIGPDIFIPLAERSGLIDMLGLQILAKAVSAAAQWPTIGLAVNVSPLQLKNPTFTETVLDTLRAASFDPSRLTVEVTEGVLISNPEQAHRAIKGLKAAGIKIALDDFGSGFASIGTLREFGFDRMKVDRSLVVAVEHSPSAARVFHATIALACALEIPVTAEGIESEEQAAIVRLSGCDELQGYLFSRPVSADMITARYFRTPRSTSMAS